MAFSSLVENRGKALWTLTTLMNSEGGSSVCYHVTLFFPFQNFQVFSKVILWNMNYTFGSKCQNGAKPRNLILTMCYLNT